MSPQRPREHELETESENHFRSLVPSKWVVRKPDPDYGIDLEAEIFEPSGEATGLTFRVQLKGTDSSFSEKPWVKVDVDTVAYWRHLDSPVLLVRYDAGTERSHARWAHGIKLGTGDTQRVRFESTDELSKGSFERLRSDVVIYRQLRGGMFRRPIKLALAVDSDATNIQDGRLRRSLRRLAQESAGLLRVAPPGEGTISITVSKWTTRIALPTS